MVTLPARVRLALSGAFGGILPEIVNLYQKRDAAIDLSYLTTEHYLLLTTIYLGSAAVVAAIFPYRRNASVWRAMLVGIALPTLIGTGASVGRAALPAPMAIRGDEPATPTLLDLLALF